MKTTGLPLEQQGFIRCGVNYSHTAKQPICILFEHLTVALDHRGKWLKYGRYRVHGFTTVDAKSWGFRARRRLARVRRGLRRIKIK
jgi:hypothetical protein